MIAAFTLILQLISAARGLEIAHAVSEAFMCATTALFLVYVASLLDTANHKRFFSMPSAGILPLDAVIGSAWFCAAMTSATGMALSGVKHNQQRAALMFHQYGYHASIVLPSFLMLWLYNYDANNPDEPVYKGIKLVKNNNITVTHTIIFTAYACIWGWFVLTQFLGEGLLTSGKQWLAWREMSCGASVAYVTAAIFKFLGRSGCVLVPLSASFAAKTYAQQMMAWVLVGIAGAYALDLLGSVERLFGMHKQQPLQSNFTESYHSIPTAPIIESEFVDSMETVQPRGNRNDPAAFVLSAAPSEVSVFPPRPQQWTRDKMV